LAALVMMPRPAANVVAEVDSDPVNRLEEFSEQPAAETAPAIPMLWTADQQQLPLVNISKGRFDKGEPTLHNGEDLDIPTYQRRNIILN
jgi:cell division protein FtsZ